MEPRPILKTTEFWIAPIMAALAFICQQFGIVDFTAGDAANFIPTIVWVGSRILQKLIGQSDTGGVRAWKTIPFWVGVLFPFVQALIPTLPPGLDVQIQALVSLVVGGGTVAPAFKNVDIGKPKESEPTDAPKTEG